ncbi:NtaA/DmoA family FMN-dependent monooxygenase [Agromyces aerolatus]|uniref:NtaA/DmoA family FMN-dependent monooxygenase n=1 Tax=Agromyces sp. LY-1074 TaxID=3074080 RepID=UPI0028637DD4|nr:MULTISPECIES: NtaA/DmoA family FMN-dependent monooxygenase [unclassified Agromyces]MDR5699461.1 NtaA/DmoA family FMN-dependent monooxygenase [Agromyces sp. LY-1074]MDR5705757.1 NtaA/DmoA family FMN-dependent monooxygenase [Agromyces sp. LY-1358]
MPRNEHMALTAFMLVGGFHAGTWRLPNSRAEEIGQLEYVVELTRMAEAAKLDAAFFGDAVYPGEVPGPNPTLTAYEPIGTLGALAAMTSKIGLVGTITTSFSEPYNVARQLANLDNLSGGRIGWNIVTSWAGNRNFGLDEMPDPEVRYRRAAEFVAVTKQLWDSWSDDAVVVDREGGSWAAADRIRRIDHEGEFFKVEGPTNIRRSPQGFPVMAQAGSSPTGLAFGASVAELVYTAQPVRAEAEKFYGEFKRRVREAGRNPEHAKILPGLLPIIGETEQEAKELSEHMAQFIDLEHGRKQFSASHEIDLSDIDLDERIPDDRWSDDPVHGSRYHLHRRFSQDDRYTLRELLVTSARSMSHLSMVGTPSRIADEMVAWFEGRACDGFSLNAPDMPDGMRRICDLLVPELRERGYFREEYEGSTLRDHLGLERPASYVRAS